MLFTFLAARNRMNIKLNEYKLKTANKIKTLKSQNIIIKCAGVQKIYTGYYIVLSGISSFKLRVFFPIHRYSYSNMFIFLFS